MPIPHRSSRSVVVFFIAITGLISLTASGPIPRTFAQIDPIANPLTRENRTKIVASGPGFCDLGGASPIEIEANGTTTGYANLKSAFDLINAGSRTGAIQIDICGDTTEAGAAVLNGSGIGPANYTSVTIRPVGGARIIQGSISASGVVKLNSADNVTIDGRLDGTGDGRFLSIRNLLNSANTAAIWLSSGSSSNGATNNTIRNLELSTGTDTTVSGNSSFGIFMGGANIGITTDGVDNDDNSFVANRITRTRYGIVTRGASANLSLSTIITDNVIGASEFGSDQVGKTGIYAQHDTGATISRNLIQNIGCLDVQLCAAGDRFGIAIGGDDGWSFNTTGNRPGDHYIVTNNIVRNIVEEIAGSAVGIRIGTGSSSGTPTNNLIANNFISGVRSNGVSAKQAAGIGISGGNWDKVVFNTISMTGDVDPGSAMAAGSFSSGIRISVANSATHSNLTLKNNSIFIDLTSGNATVRFYAITGTSSSYSFGAGGLDHNNYFINPANSQLQTGGFTILSGPSTTSQFPTLSNWRAAYSTPQDPNSIQADPLFVSTADLHIGATSPNRNSGSAMADILADIDGNARDATPDIGADEVVSPTAANVSLGGRVMSANGLYVANAVMKLEGGDLAEPRFARTNGFGHYHFDGLTAGSTYIVTVNSKRFTFSIPSRAVNMFDSVDDADFVAEP